MWAVYFDESGVHETSPVIVMAGYLSTVEEWAEFSNRWVAVLHRYDLDCFHMADFNGGYQEFDGRHETERRELLNELTLLIRKYTQVGIVTSFNMADYESVMQENSAYKIVKPYMLCAMMCINSVNIWAEMNDYTESIPFVFDRGARYSGQFKEAYDFYLKRHSAEAREYRFGSFVLEDKRRFIPIQAADVLAYGSYRLKYNEVVSRPNPIRYKMRRIMKAPLMKTHFGRDEIKNSLVGIDALLEQS